MRIPTEICIQMNSHRYEIKKQGDILHTIIESIYELGLEYGLNHNEEEVNIQLDSAIEIRNKLESTQPGIDMYRMISRYIDAILWVLEK